MFRSFPTGKRKFQKNSKNTIKASFLAKIGWKRLMKRGNKNYRSVSFLRDRVEKIAKKLQKI